MKTVRLFLTTIFFTFSVVSAEESTTLNSEVLEEPDSTPFDDSNVQVRRIDYQWVENGESHKTARFDLMKKRKSLVVRRGQVFFMDMELSRDIDSTESEAFHLHFQLTGSSANESILSNEWKTEISLLDAQRLRVSVTPSADAPIGRWRGFVEFGPKGSPQKWTATGPIDPIYVLFNPWNERDAVYMASEEDRREYVSDDEGYLFRQTADKRKQLVPWTFGQYESDVLECALSAVTDVAQLPLRQMGDPVAVSRYLTAGLNADDDQGVLESNWSGEYSDGVAPSRWTNSWTILQRFHETRTPVKYGQCWVYAGIYVAAARALGLPTRVVSGYKYLVDKNGNLNRDVHLYRNNSVREMEAVWNYHVWNEAWMRRDDSSDSDGWQVVDATPQIKSRGIVRYGPVPVKAIREADLKKPYDSRFKFAAVNARTIVWKEGQIVWQDTQRVSGSIFTYNSKLAEQNLTDAYLYQGPWSQSKSVTEANEYKDFDNVLFKTECGSIAAGSPFSILLTIDNRDKIARNLTVALRVETTDALGLPKRVLRELNEGAVRVEPGSEKRIRVDCSVDQSANILDGDRLKTTLVAHDAATGSFLLRESDHSYPSKGKKAQVQYKSIMQRISNFVKQRRLAVTKALKSAALSIKNVAYF